MHKYMLLYCNSMNMVPYTTIYMQPYATRECEVKTTLVAQGRFDQPEDSEKNQQQQQHYSLPFRLCHFLYCFTERLEYYISTEVYSTAFEAHLDSGRSVIGIHFASCFLPSFLPSFLPIRTFFLSSLPSRPVQTSPTY